MKSEKSKKILAFVLCMVLMLTTSMSTMAEGGLIGGTSSESMASQEPETKSTETTTTGETQAEGINESRKLQTEESSQKEEVQQLNKKQKQLQKRPFLKKLFLKKVYSLKQLKSDMNFRMKTETCLQALSQIFRKVHLKH